VPALLRDPATLLLPVGELRQAIGAFWTAEKLCPNTETVSPDSGVGVPPFPGAPAGPVHASEHSSRSQAARCSGDITAVGEGLAAVSDRRKNGAAWKSIDHMGKELTEAATSVTSLAPATSSGIQSGKSASSLTLLPCRAPATRI
jgi:hypothetical protein